MCIDQDFINLSPLYSFIDLSLTPFIFSASGDHSRQGHIPVCCGGHGRGARLRGGRRPSTCNCVAAGRRVTAGTVLAGHHCPRRRPREGDCLSSPVWRVKGLGWCCSIYGEGSFARGVKPVCNVVLFHLKYWLLFILFYCIHNDKTNYEKIWDI